MVPGLCFTDPWSILFQISWCLLCCFLEGVSNWLGSSAHSVLYSCVASGGSLCLSGPRLHAGWVMLVLSAMPLQAVGSPQEAPFGFEEDSEGQSRTQVIGSYPQLGKQIPGPWAVGTTWGLAVFSFTWRPSYSLLELGLHHTLIHFSPLAKLSKIMGIHTSLHTLCCHEIGFDSLQGFRDKSLHKIRDWVTSCGVWGKSTDHS